MPSRRLAAGGELAGVAEPAGAGGEEVGVEGQDHVGLVEVIADRDVLAEGEPGPGARVVAPGGLVLVPLRLGEVRRAGRGSAAARVGEVTVSVRIRSPAPFAARCASMARDGLEQEVVPGADLPPCG